MANLLLAVPYGLGAGGVDAALNNCVAIHYASRHMNWLHCMRGIGASAAGQCAMVVVSGDVVQANPEFAPSRWVYAVAGILGVACVEAAMVLLWNLLTLVDRLDVFSGRAVRWVDAIIACAAVEAALVLFVTLYGGLAHAEYRDPASGAYVDVALGAPGVVPAGRGRPAAARGVRAADAGHALAAEERAGQGHTLLHA
jgi:hypothetical protein